MDYSKTPVLPDVVSMPLVTPASQIFGLIREKKHVIWDWNGTLLDDLDHAISSANQFLDEHGLERLNRERHRKIFGFPIRQFYVDLGFDFARESFESLCERYGDRFMTGFEDLKLHPGMLELLGQIKAAGISQSILSASDQPSLDRLMEHYELTSYFDRTFGISDRLAHSKIERGRELISLSPHELSDTLMIGDTIHDWEVAQALGIDVLLVGHGHQCGTRLRAVHHLVVG
ncbi:MAG: HAD family hydrolase [Proteobacteria bacterium]|nr:MAG: HAD family hydrolase [Pseudomonadota bacterium]